MGRLIQGALYSNEMTEEHKLRAELDYPCSIGTDEELYKVCERLTVTDPNGEKSLRVLKEIGLIN